MYIKPVVRLDIARYYLNNDVTLMQTAVKFHVNYRTAFKWVKSYQKGGEARLLEINKKPWNKARTEFEERIVILKEKEPGLTIRKAKAALEKQGMEISIKGIWAIWKRYGYIGFKKDDFSIEFPAYLFSPLESRYGLKKAERFVTQKNFHLAGKVLSELPSCPKNEVLKNIPERYLSPKRNLERLYSLFGKIPYPVLLQNLIILRKEFESMGCLYSTLRTGILEALAFAGCGEIEKELILFTHLREIYQEEKLDPGLRFSFFCIKGIAHIRHLRVSEAIFFMRKCEQLVKKYPTSYFVLNLLIFYDNLGYYHKIERMLKRYEKKLNEDNVLFLKSRLYITQGKYRNYRTLIRRLETKDKKINPLYALQKAQYLLMGKGDIYNATHQMQLFLKIVKEIELRIYWGFASLFLAVLYGAQGEGRKAKNLLKKYYPLLKKFGNKKDVLLYEIIMNQPSIPEDIKKINQNYLLLLLKKSCSSLKINDYKKAYQYAEMKGLLGILHRFSFLFPEIIQFLLEKGKPTGLPRAVLRLPVFNKKTPVYHIKFLGSLTVYKNQQYLKIKLRPKDIGFLISLCIRAREPHKSIDLEGVYANFWRGTKNPSRIFSHLLVRIKKALRMPGHFLTISARTGLGSIVNEGIYFNTDYQEFEQVLVQAKALERAGEWNFARKEYLRALRLFRGEPLKKNFDEWSLDFRQRILRQLETMSINFTKSCVEHNDRKIAKKVLKKALNIIPDSEEIKKLSNGLKD